jgi:hypothetical protein
MGGLFTAEHRAATLHSSGELMPLFSIKQDFIDVSIQGCLAGASPEHFGDFIVVISSMTVSDEKATL